MAAWIDVTLTMVHVQITNCTASSLNSGQVRAVPNHGTASRRTRDVRTPVLLDAQNAMRDARVPQRRVPTSRLAAGARRRAVRRPYHRRPRHLLHV